EDQDTGTGNLHALPLFVDADNDDYHLWYTSPCIDAGDPSSSYANEPNGGGGRIDMGAYGNTAEAATTEDEDADGIDDRWEETYWPGQDPNLHDPNDDPDADGLRNKDEYYIHWDPNTDDSGSVIGLVHNERVDVNLPSISLALSMAENADTLILDSNTYYEVINFNGKPVHLRSMDPNDPNVVAATIIDANNTSLDVAVFNSGEDANSILDGITVRGGKYGISCTSSSSPTLTKCVIRNNSSYGVYAYVSSLII
ncbi:MAG: right-handed parallel beta-helix repeat-containing protein, partial [bacterium]|nr:right-handed parallel beta-helix repeat-containing protein [bacterium]